MAFHEVAAFGTRPVERVEAGSRSRRRYGYLPAVRGEAARVLTQSTVDNRGREDYNELPLMTRSLLID